MSSNLFDLKRLFLGTCLNCACPHMGTVTKINEKSANHNQNLNFPVTSRLVGNIVHVHILSFLIALANKNPNYLAKHSQLW